MFKEQAPQQRLNDFNLKIADEFSIPANAINNLSIDYDIEKPYVSGSFELETEFDLGNALQFKGETNLQLQAKDVLDYQVNEKFVIFDFNCSRESVNRFVSSGKFIDVVSWDLSKKFVSKGFNNCDLKDVISDVDVGKEALEKSTKELEFDELKKVENFVVSSDKNLLSVQDRMKEYFNCVYFQTHNKIKIKTWNKLYRNNTLTVGDTEVTYANPAESGTPLFDVIEYKNISAQGIDVSKFGARVKTYSYNPLKRTVKPFEYDLTQANRDLNNIEEMKEIPVGTKSVYISHINPEEQIKYTFQRHLMFNSQFMLLASGFFCVNPGETVNLSIKGHENSVENISGKYLITKVTDSITQGYLTQRVVLSRPTPANPS